jgi:tetratricopeptide (TPR) repeat protein
VREQIVTEHPQSEAACEALYKIGLDLLFHEHRLSDAMENFADAAKRKVPFWSDAARTSLGLCLFHQQRPQKALLELRKVAYQDQPSAHTVTALSFIEIVYQAAGNVDETKRARQDRIAQLERLAAANPRDPGGSSSPSGTDSPSVGERGYFLYLLGLACRDLGDDARATTVLNEAKALGPGVLGAELYRSVIEALR